MGVVSGGGGGAAFNGGTITAGLNVNPTDNTKSPLIGATAPAGFEANSAGDLLRLQCEDGTLGVELDTYGDFFFKAPAGQGAAQLRVASADNLARVAFLHTSNGVGIASSVGDLSVQLDGGADVFRVGNTTSGGILTTPPAPTTATLSSGTGAQLSTARDVHSYTPVTFNPTAGAAATCAVALSKDGTNYTALWTETEPAGIAFDGTVHGINVYVPAAWKLRLTVANATIGTTTYY